jgi:hypothetical protein
VWELVKILKRTGAVVTEAETAAVVTSTKGDNTIATVTATRQRMISTVTMMALHQALERRALMDFVLEDHQNTLP